MTLEDMTPADCQAALSDAIDTLDMVLEVLARQTSYGCMLIGLNLKEAKRTIREAHDDLRREAKR